MELVDVQVSLSLSSMMTDLCLTDHHDMHQHILVNMWHLLYSKIYISSWSSAVWHTFDEL